MAEPEDEVTPAIKEDLRTLREHWPQAANRIAAYIRRLEAKIAKLEGRP